MSEDLTYVKKAILYKANHRGSLESDFLIGRFVAHIVASLPDEEVLFLKAWVEMDDASFFAQLDHPEFSYQNLVQHFLHFKKAL